MALIHMMAEGLHYFLQCDAGVGDNLKIPRKALKIKLRHGLRDGHLFFSWSGSGRKVRSASLLRCDHLHYLDEILDRITRVSLSRFLIRHAHLTTSRRHSLKP
ncbi:hypothetical protein M758_1G121200 [Ceratodon purpureus]|nr:hypothetical protein M758_1G121200 [Ceratodon purpureus]